MSIVNETINTMKGLWCRYHGDNRAIKDDLTHIDKMDVSAEREDIRLFDMKYDSLTCLENDFDKLTARSAANEAEITEGDVPYLIRWNKNTITTQFVKDCLIADEGYNKSVFVLTNDLTDYRAISDIPHVNVVGLIFDEKGKKHKLMSVMSHLTYDTILETNNIEEIAWMARVFCKHLVVGGKSYNDPAYQNFASRITSCFCSKDGVKMAIPGKAGCFSNSLLKMENVADKRTFMFIDNIEDIQNMVDRFGK